MKLDEHNAILNRDAALMRAAADILELISVPYSVDPIYWVGVKAKNGPLYHWADRLDGGKS